MTNQNSIHDVIIIGGGLIGLLQSLSLAVHGISSALIDRSNPKTMRGRAFDGRTSAVTSASMNMLELLGLDETMLASGANVAQIIVRDGHDGPPIIFNDGASLATVFENQKLRVALLDVVQNHDLISTYFSSEIIDQIISDSGISVTLCNGASLSADLLIGADGSNSNVRKSAKIALSQWQYDHKALVGAISHKKPHDNIAYELFFNEGPLALLPMPNDVDGRYRSSLIWSVPGNQSAAYQKLSPAIFCHELDKKTSELLGKSDLIAPLISYPLGFHSANNLTAKRIALIGDSGHRVHPIAGQGLNLGFRDVAALTEILVDGLRLGLECGDAQLLARYEKWRSVDNLSVSVATDSLNHIYAMRGKMARGVRRLGMDIIQRSDSIKSYLTSEARGAAGELPKLLSGHLI